jgi:hypothetical protein
VGEKWLNDQSRVRGAVSLTEENGIR